VELAKAEERARQISEGENRARARLSTWLGEASRLDLSDDWPSLPDPLPLDDLYERIKTHPRILALQKKINYSETGV